MKPLLFLLIYVFATCSQADNSSFLVHSKSFVMMVFQLNANDVQGYLPKGLQAKSTEKGKVTAFLEVYEAERVAGYSPYKVAFIVVEVSDHNSRTAVPGHFAIWGKTEKSSDLIFFRDQLGFPYSAADSITQERKASVVSLELKTERQGFKAQINILSEQSGESSGVVNMLSLQKQKLVNIEVPFMSKGHQGQLVDWVVTPGKDPILKLLRQTKIDYVWIADEQIFTYLPQTSVN